MGANLMKRKRGGGPGNICYQALYMLFWLFVHCVCRYEVSGQEHIPADGPLLIVANHLSWFDPFLLGIILRRRVWFFTKEEVFRWPIIGWLAHLTGQIPVRRGGRDRMALMKAILCLREGNALVIFPEGTVERQEQMISARTGAAMLAVHSETTILPVAHSGTRRVLRAHSGLRPHVNIWIGESYKPVPPESVSRKAELQFITDEMMDRIARMLPSQDRGIYR